MALFLLFLHELSSFGCDAIKGLVVVAKPLNDNLKHVGTFGKLVCVCLSVFVCMYVYVFPFVCSCGYVCSYWCVCMPMCLPIHILECMYYHADKDV